MKKYILILAVMLLPLAAEAQIKIWDGTSCGAKQVTLTEYLPEGEARGAIIVCPGGSYHWLDMKSEGKMVAEALAQEGYVAYVLKYRVAGKFEFVSKYRSVLRLGSPYLDVRIMLSQDLSDTRDGASGAYSGAESVDRTVYLP